MKDTQQLNERYLLNYFIFVQAMHLGQYYQVWCCYVGCMVTLPTSRQSFYWKTS